VLTGAAQHAEKDTIPHRRGVGRAKQSVAWLLSLASLVSMNAVAAPPLSASPTVEELRALSIEDLANIEIISVSKRPEPLSQAPASIYVITSEDIRRSGAVTLPDVLRLAPNLQVSRVSSSGYAISARGFSTFESAIKLLVLIDGRSIYTPLHAGVFWDQNQVMVEDIDRIEVISGPGGTLWGANAFNGVINIITRNSSETQGGLLSGQYGNVDQRAAVRYGGKLGEHGSYRVYAQDLERGPMAHADGTSATDAWDSEQGGFRTDWAAGNNAFTVQGDIFDNAFDVGNRNRGKNLLTRWKHQLGGGSSLELQAYYDTVDRTAPGVSDALETYDFQAQHSFRLGDNHQIVWGGGYRVVNDEFINHVNVFVLQPESDTLQLGNVFGQDSIKLENDLTLTLGTKFEHSSLSGLDYLPSARLAWQVTPDHMLWTAVSRAVRTPSRFDRDLTAPGFLEPASDFESEKLMAYEIGYRGQPTTNTSLSTTLFLHDYSDLRVLAVSPTSGLFTFDNKMEGIIYGIEAWGDYQVRPWWRLSAGFTLMQKNLDLKPGAVTAALDQHAGNDPDHQFSIRSSMDLLDNVEFDIGLRSIDDLPNPTVPSYLELDARIAWQVTDQLELSISGFNLLDNRHPETGAAATRIEVPRTVLAGARWRF
jgi:iron complex outermembrane receptor protein